MNLQSRLLEDMKSALKSGDKVRLETVRLLRAQMKDAQIAKQAELTPEDELSVLMNAAKKRKEAIEFYEKSNRLDLLEKERRELEIISEYLPRQLSDEELDKTITELIQKVGATSIKDLGKVMSLAMKELKGKADGKKVQELVRNKLA